jgi:hypothetical protein
MYSLGKGGAMERIKERKIACGIEKIQVKNNGYVVKGSSE